MKEQYTRDYGILIEPERRKANVRRDLNDLVRSEDGKVAESKVWANIGKGIASLLLLFNIHSVIDKWEALTVLLIILVMPDLLKKLLYLKYNGKLQNTTSLLPPGVKV